MLGSNSAFCLLLALCYLSNFIGCSRQCTNSTFASHILDGCVECPINPKINCQNEDIMDVASCIKGCVKANTTRRYHKNKPTPTVNLPTIVRERLKTETKNVNKVNKMNRQYIGGITLDNFIVLVCVVVIGVPVLAYAIWKCSGVNRPTFAGYRLMIYERTAAQGKQTVCRDNQQRDPLAVKLTVWNQEEQQV